MYYFHQDFTISWCFSCLGEEEKQHFMALSFMLTGLGEGENEFPWLRMADFSQHFIVQSKTALEIEGHLDLHTFFAYYIVGKYVTSDAASVYAWKQASAVKTWITFSRYYRPLGSQVYHEQTQLTFTQMPWREYGVGTKWEWVNNDIIFIVQLKLFI